LFSGIGGFRLGLEKANNSINKTTLSENGLFTKRHKPNSERRTQRHNQNFRTIWANDWDKHANAIYKARFGEKELFEGDIRSVNADRIPDFDLLCAGFPCQPFSIAGKRKGFEDTRGTLFFEILRVLKAKKPSLILLENVKGLLSAQRGYAFFRIIEALDELGYDLEWQVLDSQYFGVPQHRERVFIAGHLGGTGIGKILPIQQGSEIFSGASEEARGARQWVQNKRVCSKTILQREYKGDNQLVAEGGLMRSARIRRLTPVECERLQGFPDGWTAVGVYDGERRRVSDTQRYKCLGNAVTTNVVTSIGWSIQEALKEKGKGD